jgi:hypothetical protein
MPIDTKPEEKTLSGPELEAAITDGIQRAIGRRVANIRVLHSDMDRDNILDRLYITVEVAGSLKGPKPGAKRKPRSKPAAPSSAS